MTEGPASIAQNAPGSGQIERRTARRSVSCPKPTLTGLAPLSPDGSRSGALPWRPSRSPGTSSPWNPAPAPTVIIVDDGREPTGSRIDYFRARGFTVIPARAPILMTAASRPLLYLIEGRAQFHRLQALRARAPLLSRARAIVIAHESDLPIELLDLGADDVVTRTCHNRELLSRIKAVLGLNRRPPAPTAAAIYDLGALGAFTPHDLSLRLANGTAINLTRSECGLLERLARSPRVMVSRDDLLASLGDRDADVFDRTIDLRISRLRKRLALHGGPQVIQTCRGAGYRLNADVRRYCP